MARQLTFNGVMQPDRLQLATIAIHKKCVALLLLTLYTIQKHHQHAVIGGGPSSMQNIKLKKCTHLKQRLAQLAAILLLASAHAQPGAVLLVSVTDGQIK